MSDKQPETFVALPREVYAMRWVEDKDINVPEGNLWEIQNWSEMFKMTIRRSDNEAERELGILKMRLQNGPNVTVRNGDWIVANPVTEGVSVISHETFVRAYENGQVRERRLYHKDMTLGQLSELLAWCGGSAKYQKEESFDGIIVYLPESGRMTNNRWVYPGDWIIQTDTDMQSSFTGSKTQYPIISL